jgi:hypothetical protein
MLSDKSKVIELFEHEVWLYLDNDLEDDRMEFWENQISSNAELQKILNETKQLLNIYNAEMLESLDEPVFEKIVSNVTKPSLFSKMKSIFGSEGEFGISLPKIALVTTLALASLIMLIMNDKPNQVKTISNELLDWDAGSITQQMDDIQTGLSMVEKDNYSRYLMLKIQNQEWDKNIYSISKDLEKLKKELNETSM